MDYEFELQVIIEALKDDGRIDTVDQKKWRSTLIRRAEEMQAYTRMLNLPEPEAQVRQQWETQNGQPVTLDDTIPASLQEFSDGIQPVNPPAPGQV